MPPHQARDPLARRLGFWSALGLVVGITIGSGIFRTPASIAARVPDPTLMLGVWLIGGLVSLAGALSVAELAATFPYTGGWYVYLREGWGRLAGFLFGWAELVLIRAAANVRAARRHVRVSWSNHEGPTSSLRTSPQLVVFVIFVIFVPFVVHTQARTRSPMSPSVSRLPINSATRRA